MASNANLRQNRHSARELYREMQAQGVPGQYSLVADSVRRLRPVQGRLSQHRKAGAPATIAAVDRPLTPSRAPWVVMRRETTRNDDAKQQRARLHAQEGEIAEAIECTQACAALGRRRQPEHLAAWLERAITSGLQAFKSVANG